MPYPYRYETRKMTPRALPRQTGFTLVEIAIVLVIIGLILGGVLKGQELVTSARVRNIADQQNAIKAAFFAFQDRYHAVPGDYAQAADNIPGLQNQATKANGDGDGFIAYDVGTSKAATTGTEASEQVWAFLHLTAAGFISCSQCVSAGAAGGMPSQTNSPLNAYAGVIGIGYDNVFGYGAAATAPNPTNNLKTGNKIPSNILAEVDTKLDDGNPYTGVFQFSLYQGGGTGVAPDPATCVALASGGTAPGNSVWNRQTPASNCGAAYTF